MKELSNWKMVKTNIKIVLLACVMTCFASINGPASAQSTQQLFQQALQLEEGAGDLEGAINLYMQIIEDSASDRFYLANAHLHLGYCHENERIRKDYAFL